MDVSRCAPSVLYAYDLGALWVSGWMPGPRTPPGAQSCADTPTRVRAHRRANPVNETLSVQFDFSWAGCTLCTRHVAAAWRCGRKDASSCLSPTATRLLAFDPAGCRGLDQPPARRRLVPPTRRDELRDSACAQIAVGGCGIGPTYPTRRMSAGRRVWRAVASLAVDNSMSHTKSGSSLRRSR